MDFRSECIYYFWVYHTITKGANFLLMMATSVHLRMLCLMSVDFHIQSYFTLLLCILPLPLHLPSSLWPEYYHIRLCKSTRVYTNIYKRVNKKQHLLPVPVQKLSIEANASTTAEILWVQSLSRTTGSYSNSHLVLQQSKCSFYGFIVQFYMFRPSIWS